MNTSLPFHLKHTQLNNMYVSLSYSLQNRYYFLFQNSDLEYYLEFHIILFFNIKESLERPQKHYMEMSHGETLYYENVDKRWNNIYSHTRDSEGILSLFLNLSFKIWSTGVSWKKWKE